MWFSFIHVEKVKENQNETKPIDHNKNTIIKNI